MAAACCPANIRETKLGIGYQAQPDLVTPNTAGEMWTISKVNAALSTVNPTTEDNGADIGKGDEFPTQVFPVSMDVSCSIEKYISSEVAAWMFAFSLGDVTEAVSGTGVTYTCEPADPIETCLELPAFTIVEQIRTGVDAIVDRGLVGMVINDWALTLESGPGRNNARMTVNCVGTGKVLSPSGIVLPAILSEHFLNASSATITVGTPPIDYVLNRSFIRCEVRWNNNIRLDSGFYPGSGTQNGFALRGRMEFGDRTCEITFSARACKGSPEYNQLLTLATGPADITLTGAVIGAGPTTHGITLHFPAAQFSSVVNGEADGLVTVDCTLRPIKATGQPYCTFTATTIPPGVGTRSLRPPGSPHLGPPGEPSSFTKEFLEDVAKTPAKAPVPPPKKTTRAEVEEEELVTA